MQALQSTLSATANALAFADFLEIVPCTAIFKAPQI
jgi:hypothetical protein